MASLPRKIAEP